jgi:hypothetical protein
MTINHLSVGKDCTIDLFDPMAGGPVSFAIITSFESKVITTKLRSKGMDGYNRFGTEYDGWDLTMTLDRAGPALDNFVYLRETAYHAGLPMQAMTLTQTVQEADGTTTTWRYEGLDLEFPDMGNYKNGSLITQKITGQASIRRKVS